MHGLPKLLVVYNLSPRGFQLLTLELELGLGLGTGNGYFVPFFFILK